MSMLFSLTPESDVVYISEDDTLGQASEKMERHKHSAVSIVGRAGHYVRTLTEGGLLWGIKNQSNLDLKGAERVPVTAIRRQCDSRPVKAGTDMEDLIGKALDQNFVSVLDDQKSLIGIITGKNIIKYFYQKCEAAEGRSKRCQDQGGREHKKTDLSAAVKLRSREGVLVWRDKTVRHGEGCAIVGNHGKRRKTGDIVPCRYTGTWSVCPCPSMSPSMA